VLVTEYSSQNLDTIDCQGNVSVLATIPPPNPAASVEKYLAIAPALSANATPAPFTPRDIFVTQGHEIWQVRPPSPPTLFATIPDCSTGGEPHTGITFDHVGTFGYNMIVTCQDGGVWQVDGSGTLTPIANVADTGGPVEIEGPAIAAASFGPLNSQILVADELNNVVWAIAPGPGPNNTVTDACDMYGLCNFGAESVQVIPSAPCTYCSGALFQAIEDFNVIIQYPQSNFTGLGGDILVTSEFSTGTARFHWNDITSTYDYFPFDNTIGTFEGSAFADCDVPAPTPTSTPTPTAAGTDTPTPTPTPTATATAAATFTPEPTATFTPLPTATFTPEPTATFTPLPTATFTPLPTATFTPEPTATFTP
jgi:hypothetical protein